MDFEFQEQKVSMSCTWGEGSDVSINIQRTQRHFNKYTDPLFVPLDLTAQEAIEFGKHLMKCGIDAMKCNLDYANYVIKDLQKNKGIDK